MSAAATPTWRKDDPNVFVSGSKRHFHSANTTASSESGRHQEFLFWNVGLAAWKKKKKREKKAKTTRNTANCRWRVSAAVRSQNKPVLDFSDNFYSNEKYWWSMSKNLWSAGSSDWLISPNDMFKKWCSCSRHYIYVLNNLYCLLYFINAHINKVIFPYVYIYTYLYMHMYIYIHIYRSTYYIHMV